MKFKSLLILSGLAILATSSTFAFQILSQETHLKKGSYFDGDHYRVGNISDLKKTI